jgi:ribosome-associated heat shock protein Hsp15
MSDAPVDSVRIDKWLWAARLFKTRSLAAKACAGGHVTINGETAKPAKVVHPGDRIEAHTPGGLRIVLVRVLSDKRGPASVARNLLDDLTPPPPPRELIEPFARRERGAGRPTKRERRVTSRLRGD